MSPKLNTLNELVTSPKLEISTRNRSVVTVRVLGHKVLNEIATARVCSSTYPRASRSASHAAVSSAASVRLNTNRALPGAPSGRRVSRAAGKRKRCAAVPYAP